nr:DNA-binding response regulator [uncultured Flavobacterium sp.]
MDKILIIEDEIILATDLTELIQQLGFEIAVAYRYADAIDVAKVFRPDLILCDINLNENKNGIDLVKDLRAGGHDFEVIYLTAYSSEDIFISAALTEPFNYLTKPFNDAQIEVAIRLAFNFISQKTVVSSLRGKVTHMELKILELIAAQKTSKEIAELLYISSKTVRNHRYNMAKKLGVPAGNNSLTKWAISNFKPFDN